MSRDRAQISDREVKRAEALHAAFSKYAPLIEEKSLAFCFPKIKQAIRGKRIKLARGTCYRIFRQWKANPSAETMIRNWAAPARKYSDLQIQAVMASAVLKGVPVRSIAASLENAPSYRTIIHRSKHVKKITRLVRLASGKKRLTKQEQEILKELSGK